jgi:hypothetical protein
MKRRSRPRPQSRQQVLAQLRKGRVDLIQDASATQFAILRVEQGKALAGNPRELPRRIEEHRRILRVALCPIGLLAHRA